MKHFFIAILFYGMHTSSANAQFMPGTDFYYRNSELCDSINKLKTITFLRNDSLFGQVIFPHGVSPTLWDTTNIYRCNFSYKVNLSKWQTDSAVMRAAIPTNTNQLTNGAGFISSFTETDPTFNTKFAAKTTDGLTEGTTNLYYTSTRFNTAFSGKNTDGLSEGTTNLYYTTARFNTAFSGKTTTNLSEGTNLYYTDTRSRSSLSAGTNISYNNSTGVITNTYSYTPPTPTLDTINAGARLFNTAYQISTTKYIDITLSGSVSCNLSLSGGQAGTISLQVSPNGSTGWKTWGIIQGSNTGSLTVGLNTTQISGSAVSASLAPGDYWKLTTTSTTGTPTFTFSGGGTKTYN